MTIPQAASDDRRATAHGALLPNERKERSSRTSALDGMCVQLGGWAESLGGLAIHAALLTKGEGEDDGAEHDCVVGRS